MKKNVFWLGAAICFIFPLLPNVSNFASGLSMLLGIILSTCHLIDVPSSVSQYRKLSLNSAVVLFGFGLSIQEVIRVGSRGIIQSVMSLVIVIIVGYILLKILKVENKLGQLIIYGTAICGGSAIAATAPVLEASDDDIAISTGVIFLLNTIALFLFMWLSGIISFTETQFGTWIALSVHDTSSVVGAASYIGDTALDTAVILKLTRTLWIIPIVIILSLRQKNNKKAKIPLFILLFIAASVFASIVPLPSIYSYLKLLGKMLLSLALFFVGVTLNPETIRKVGMKSLLFGCSLWVISLISGYNITYFS